jgi:hypothetical protein
MLISSPFPLVDAALAQRLERAEAEANIACVEARSRRFPDSGATWASFGSARAMFDGIGSPLTQTFGLGLPDPPGSEEVDAIESFFTSRGAAVEHEICALVDPSFLRGLVRRGYQPIEWSDVLVRPIDAAERWDKFDAAGIVTEQIQPSEHEDWARLAARGWSEFPDIAGQMLELSRIVVSRPGGLSFMAKTDGVGIATAGLFVHDRVALMAGASTVPEARRRGAQRALLGIRFRTAAESGCDLAMIVALPGQTSHMNAQKVGFRMAYSRTKWRLAA